MNILFLFILILNSIAIPNYILNPSFEEGIANNPKLPKDWYLAGGNCQRTKETSHSGEYSLHCSVYPGLSLSGPVQWTENLIFGLKYNVSAWIKLKNVRNNVLMIPCEGAGYSCGVYPTSNNIEECKDGNSACSGKLYCEDA